MYQNRIRLIQAPKFPSKTAATPTYFKIHDY